MHKSKTYVKFNSFILDGKSVRFLSGGEVVGEIALPCEFRTGDTLTVTDINGKFEVKGA
jgi:hypothetical protein